MNLKIAGPVIQGGFNFILYIVQIILLVVHP
jgi:hypothetical protein